MELKEVCVRCEEVQKYLVFMTMRFEVSYYGQVVGYYRIWHDPDTVNIAWYSDEGNHGVLAPGDYQAVDGSIKMINMIQNDLHKMGYTIPKGWERITDDMLIGKKKFIADSRFTY